MSFADWDRPPDTNTGPVLLVEIERTPSFEAHFRDCSQVGTIDNIVSNDEDGTALVLCAGARRAVVHAVAEAAGGTTDARTVGRCSPWSTSRPGTIALRDDRLGTRWQVDAARLPARPATRSSGRTTYRSPASAGTTPLPCATSCPLTTVCPPPT